VARVVLTDNNLIQAEIKKLTFLSRSCHLGFTSKRFTPFVACKEPSTLAETDVKLESGVQEASRVALPRIAGPVALLLLYLAIWGCTLPHFMGDTSVYAQSILRHQHGAHTGFHQTTSNPFWDFGHLLWRPLAWFCFVSARPIARLLATQTERAQVLRTLIGLTFLAAPVCVFLFFLLAKKVIGDVWPATLAAIGLFSADAFLNYSHTGNAYIVGLTCLVAGMYFSLTGSEEGSSLSRRFLAGPFFALAVLFWLPYVFVLPAAIATPLVLYGRDKQRLRQTGQTLAICVVVGFAAYAPVLTILGIRSAADVRAWVLAAGHGQIQPGGLRPAARLAFSFPRSIMNMGQDGMWLKRYFVHDPYAPVTATELFRLSLWKLLLFYTAAGIVCSELVRSERGRKLLILLASAVVPIVGFGVFVFQAGSIDLFLPLYPFVFLAWGYALAGSQATLYKKVLLLAVLIATVIVNVNAMSRGTLEIERSRTLARIRDLIPLLRPNSVVMAINEQDDLARFCQNFPLDPINLDAEWTNYDVLEINTARLSTWREDFAKRVLASWQRGGTVWLPTRFLQAQPKPDWNWVEGDDKRVSWTDLPSFFSQFETGSPVGGGDGFVLLPQNPKNEQLVLMASETPVTAR
jgi:hypothetical protein